MCRSAAAVLVFACLHSALASRKAKHAVDRRFGPEFGKGVYRTAFNAQALLTATALISYVGGLPVQTLYRLQGRAAVLVRLVQLSGWIPLLNGLRTIGIARFSGATNLLAWFHGEEIPAGPAAQGPELRPDGGLTDGGPFRWSRHPLNFAPLLLFWFTPRLTTRRLAFNLACTVYLLLGSFHEERRLRAVYGSAYEAYLRRGVPFYLPLYHGSRMPDLS